jgi:hypothetical protein
MTNSVTLDRSKPHGKVHGLIEDGVHYHQDGLPFDAHGVLVGRGLTEAQRAKAERLAKRAARLAPREDTSDGAGGAAPDDDGDTAEAGDVNLEAWLKGDAKYLFDAVRGAIRTRYSRDVKSIGDAVEFLVLEESLVSVEKVSKRLMPK